jgi:hypothetical protein
MTAKFRLNKNLLKLSHIDKFQNFLENLTVTA